MNALIRKELREYFLYPIGYIFMSIFCALSAFFFFSSTIVQNTSNISLFFQTLFMVIILLTPILTMRLFSEEYKLHTDQLLFCSPTTIFEIVLGKYLSALIMFLLTTSMNLIYVIIICLFAKISISLIVGCLLGTTLLGAALISIGMFVSSRTESQIISAFGSFAIFLIFVFIDAISQYVPFNWLKSFMGSLAIMPKYSNLISGILNISDILYFISIIVIFVFLTVQTLEKKRWNWGKIMKIGQKFKSSIKNFTHTKKFKCSTLSVTFTAIFISIIFLINILCYSIVQKYNIQIDLSSNQLYQISDQTKSFLKTYNKKTKLILLDDEQTFKNGSPYLLHIYNISKNIAAENSNITIEYINLDQNPNFVSNYPNLQLNSGGILITDDSNNSQYLPQSKMFSQSYGDMYTQQNQIVSNVESNIAHALEFISGQNLVKTALISGHGEVDISPISQQFKDNGYNLNKLILTKDEISEDTELMISSSPKTDYTPEDIAKIEEYLNNGGSLIYFASATQTKLPNLESLLKKYGIAFSEGTVVETNSRNVVGNSTNQFYVLADSSNKYAENISIKDAPIIVKSCKPMHLEKIDDAIVQTDICSTSKTCAILNENDKNFNYLT